MIEPLTHFWNKQFVQDKNGKKIREAMLKLYSELVNLYKRTDNNKTELSPNGIYFSDDIVTVYKNMGFLDDEIFIRALGPRQNDGPIMGRLWRTWVVAWSLSKQWLEPGDKLDLGCYNGKAILTACKYSYLSNKGQILRDRLIVADLFENPPNEAKKIDHGPELKDKVNELIRPIVPNVEVIKGFIPDSLYDKNIETVSWSQIDLNSAEADIGAFEFIYEKLTKGAIVIFDDYGFSRYKETTKSY